MFVSHVPATNILSKKNIHFTEMKEKKNSTENIDRNYSIVRKLNT